MIKRQKTPTRHGADGKKSAAPKTEAPQQPDAQPAAAAQPPAAPEPDQSPPEAQELATLKDRYTRLLADFDNFRKRQARDNEEFVRRANENLLSDLLPVVDHLELALAQTPDPDDPFVIGVRLVYEQIQSLFGRYGLTPIDAKGEPFDPAFHEAISQASSLTVPTQTVIEQFRRGWMLSGRLLRPAQVVVSSGKPEPEQVEAESVSVSD
ncbi:MAG TPA: nucleotide exchange factor GrpE [Kiritimatiellia bacterium]|jgi:molecular chaperone GrpE|nr:nucleotide exchange factor GrpE [Kiritimatiellia bacterium]HOM58287.1 nucleotide exchange factor GrpE [Kiritimatiellia bacterium]HOR97909.1 nucleotide exchange factor GrpE [Kiritimatiellia bacterium]HPC48737.1 nucleotide exchange factor GrpE [Kiritimatiellia bacterium]HPK36678.1 nucleotide exchange factor GrpE [Kiritimatiellia bacterium]